MSDSKSVRTTGGGLANRLTFALSCVARNFQNGIVGQKKQEEEESKVEESKQVEGDEEIADLEQIIKEFNDLADLSVKLNSLLKIIKILEVNDNDDQQEQQYVKSLYESCKQELEQLKTSKEQAVESV